MFKLIRRIIALLVVAAIVVCVAVGVYAFNNRAQIAQEAVEATTGNADAAQAVGRIAAGEDLTDAELAEAFGLDEAAYSSFEEAANSLGVDLNDSSQLIDIAASNLDKGGELQDVLDGLSSGELSPEGAAAQLGQALGLEGE